MKKLQIWLLVLIVGLPLLGFAILSSGKVGGVSMALKTDVLSKECSPENLDYGSFGPYCAGVVRLNYWLLSKCELTVIKHGDAFPHGYGYSEKLDGPCEPPRALAWTGSGVDIFFPDRKITIPSRAFMGGR